MKKKIIFVTTALWIGGIETALINLLNHLDYERYEVTLLVLRAELDLADRVNDRCRLLIADREKMYSFDRPYPYARLYHMTEESPAPSSLHKAMMWTTPLIKWVENRLYIRYIRSLMKSEHFDAAIIYSDVAAETTIRAIDADRFLMFYHHGAMRHVYHDDIAYRKCEKIIAVSENQANALKKYVPSAADRIMVVHNLTDIEGIRAKAAEPTRETFDETKFNIVSVGRVSHEKGMDIAVHVCARLVADGYDDVRWWIVGGGPAMQEVKDTVAETHMEGHVITVGMQPNPYPYIRQANLYVQPSRFEGYPMTILEALVIGQPVVSTDNAGAREIIRHNVTGLLLPADISAIAEGIERLRNDAERFWELRENAGAIDFVGKNAGYMSAIEGLLSGPEEQRDG